MPNRNSRSPGKLSRLDTAGQVSTKPGFAVDANAGVWRSLASDLRQTGRSLGRLADNALKRREQASIEAGKTQGFYDGYNADLGTNSEADGDTSTAAPMPEGLKVVDAGKGFTTIRHKDGSVVRYSGARNWRNNNPGNLEFGDFAKSHGAIGTDGRFAVFPDYETGRKAKASLLFESGSYKSKSIASAISRYAPASENNTKAYYSAIAEAVGVPASTPLGSLSKQQRTVMLDAMERMEGFRVGKTETLGTEQRQPTTAGTGRPGPSGPALALRKDKSLQGEAYQHAQNRAISRRLPLEVSQQLEALYDEHKEDPAALSKAFDEAESGVLERLNTLSGDPELLLLGRETFARKRRVYEKSARAEEDKRVRDGERADYDEVLKSSRTSLQRQAYLVGDDEEAGADLDVAMNENLANIEDALEAGLISPQLASKQQKVIFDTVTLARIDGVFDSLPGPDEKQAFVEGLKDEWKEGEGFLKDLSLEQVDGLDRKYSGAIRAERQQATADVKLQTKKMQRLLVDDLASIGETGVGLSIDGEELNFDQVKATLGEEAATDWQRKRQVQTATFDATAGLDLLPTDEILMKLDGLEPEPGSLGYVDQVAVLNATKAEAKRITKLRKEDPAEAVDQAFEDLKGLKQQAYDGDPVALEELIKGRLDAQASLDIPEAAQAVLTNGELGRILEGLPDEADKAEWMKLAKSFDQTFGPYSGDVMTQVFQSKGLHRDLVNAAKAYLKDWEGEGPSLSEQKAIGEKAEAATADQAMNGWAAMKMQQQSQYDDVIEANSKARDQRGRKVERPAPPEVLWPNIDAITALVSNPEKASDFDAAFGAGAADYFLQRHEASKQDLKAYLEAARHDEALSYEDWLKDQEPRKPKAATKPPKQKRDHRGRVRN
ncbi:hypothetical protein SAMN04515647_3800 [Cohaesibacter sp. ES.047]|uniref:hypothetical protein n=1 Tax=Cohaesibacter sp. ES.047 TaxID=1798205 RepID=UPI000BBFE0A6|nr:hypothetical protein [Cohaesibacter sp. ES.047]SNY93503.1 hypothetical protein SAMN04515647_3800 [Cohaesibacter sp. ES.047]